MTQIEQLLQQKREIETEIEKITSGLNDESAAIIHNTVYKVINEIKKVIVGQSNLLEKLMVAIMCEGHVLVEGAPGLAKTLALKCLAQTLGVKFKRIQFTPDLLPSDLVGTRIYNPSSSSFTTEVGPLFSNFVLADEINRAPAKVQSALLESMAEHQITIGKETYQLAKPFLVMATQNPIENEGTYNLPEAQLDRFLFKILVDYPTPQEELAIIDRISNQTMVALTELLNEDQINKMIKQAKAVYIHPKLTQYIVDLIELTRDKKNTDIMYGASPRGSLAIANSSKSLALIRGRTHVESQDIKDVIHDCLRHRIILSYDAISQNTTVDDVISSLESQLALPQML